MRGKGVPKMGPFFVLFCLLLWCPNLLVLFCFKKLKTYGFDFGFLSFVVGFLWVNHCGHLGPLETFLRGLCCQNSEKLMVF